MDLMYVHIVACSFIHRQISIEDYYRHTTAAQQSDYSDALWHNPYNLTVSPANIAYLPYRM